MKNTTKAIGFFGLMTIISVTSYFIMLYESFTQMILTQGIAAMFVFLGFLYIYVWMQDKESELKAMNKAIDLTRDYMREVEERLKK